MIHRNWTKNLQRNSCVCGYLVVKPKKGSNQNHNHVSFIMSNNQHHSFNQQSSCLSLCLACCSSSNMPIQEILPQLIKWKQWVSAKKIQVGSSWNFNFYFWRDNKWFLSIGWLIFTEWCSSWQVLGWCQLSFQQAVQEVVM